MLLLLLLPTWPKFPMHNAQPALYLQDSLHAWQQSVSPHLHW
jgi:hypothetical protein